MFYKKLKQLLSSPWFPILFLLAFICLWVYREVFLQGFVPVPADTLVGAYFPWLDYKWGYSVGVPVKNPPISDVFSQFFVWKKLVIDAFRQGSFPLWNFTALSGTPLMATYHTASLFPANILMLLPQHWGWSLFIVFSTLAAALSMYLFLSFWTKNKWHKLIGAIIYAFAGPATTWTEFSTGVWAAAMFPLVFYFIDRFLLDRQKKALFWVGIFTALTILAGHAQIDSYLAIFAPIYILLRLKQEKIKQPVKKFFSLGIFMLLGGVLTSLQLLPTLEFFSNSIRAEEEYAKSFGFGLTPFYEMIRLWAGDFFGHPSTYNHFSSVSYHEYSSFLGTLSLPLIVPLFFKKKKDSKLKFLLISFLATLVLAYKNPLSTLIFSLKIPLLTYSSASRIFYLTNFLTAILITFSLSYLKDKKFIKKLNLSFIFFIIVTFIGVSLVNQPYQLISLRNSVIPLGILSSFLLFSFLKVKPKYLIFIFLLLYSFDMGRYFRKYNPLISPHLVFPTTPIIDYLTDQPGTFRIAREQSALLPPNTWGYYGLDSIEGYDPLRLLNYNRFFHLVDNEGYFNKAGRYSEIQDANPQYLDLLNVKYFLNIKPESIDDKEVVIGRLRQSGYQTVFEDKSVEILENPHVLPRAFFAQEVVVAKDEAELAQIMEGQGFNPVQTIIIYQQIDMGNFGVGKVEDISMSSNKIEISTNSDKDGLLFVSDTYDPGWRVKIDGQDAEVIVANGALKSVFVPEGEHQVIFKYRPKPFIYGLILSSTSFVILVCSYLYFSLSKKKN